jgi:hypothetical protein
MNLRHLDQSLSEPQRHSVVAGRERDVVIWKLALLKPLSLRSSTHRSFSPTEVDNCFGGDTQAGLD